MLKPSTMSLPTWAKRPVIGAMKPMRSSLSCACVFDARLKAATTAAPDNNTAVSILDGVTVIALLPLADRDCTSQ